jgi:chromate transporter
LKKNRFKTLWELFVIFFKAGTFTFAGGLAMLPVIEKDVVEKYRLMPKEDFLEYATLAQTLPGVIALNCACFVGRRAGGFLGMLAYPFIGFDDGPGNGGGSGGILFHQLAS